VIDDANNRIEAGAIKVDGVTVINSRGKGINLKNIMVSLEIFEDIMSPFITGRLTISDANSLAESLPFMGEELLILDLETPHPDGSAVWNKKRNQVFHIYKMEGNEAITAKNNVISLCFVSIEAFTDVNSRISQTFRGRISDTVRTLLRTDPGLNTSKNAVIEETANNNIHTSNFWTPTQNIYHLVGDAISTEGYPSYTFFENNEGFVFASLQSLYKLPTMAKFFRHPKTRRPGESKNIEEDWGTVLDMSTPVFYDYFDRVESGFYGGTAYRYDIETKRLDYQNLIASKDLARAPTLNPNKGFDSERLQFRPEANLHMSVIHRNIYQNSPQLSVTHFLERTALLKQLSAFTTNIQVFGRMDYSVGRPIEMTAYKNSKTNETDSSEEIIDQMLTGKYLITALTHTITRESHLCNMEISKDSIIRSL